MKPEEMKEALGEVVAPLVARLDALEKKPVTTHTAGITDAPARIPDAVITPGSTTKAARIKSQRKAYAETHDTRFHGKGLDAAAAVRFIVMAAQYGGSPEGWAQKEGMTELAEMMSAHRKSVNSAGDVASGGALIPPQLSDEVIPLLVADSVMMKTAGGLRGMPMPTGAIAIPRQTSGASVSYIGENSAPTPSTPGTDLVNLNYKKLAAVIVMSNDLLKFGGAKVDAWIRDRLVIDSSLKFDISVLRGTGTANEIAGVKTLMASGNKITATNSTTPTLAQVDSDLYSLIGAMEDANVPDDGTWGLFFAPRIKRFLAQLRDGVGQYIYRKEMDEGTLLGYPFGKTTQIPKNLGGGNETEIYAIRMSDVYYGVADELEIMFAPNGDYDDGTGTVKSGFSLDQSPIRAISRHDVKLAHPESAAMLQVVKWGG